jgi:hypothetical protein
MDAIEKKELLNKESTAIQSISGEGEAAKAIAQIEAQVWLAIKHPREEAKVRARVLAACKREGFAKKGHYNYPRKSKGGGQVDVIGGSINLAKELARTWGNINYGMIVISDSDDERTIRGVAWDMESNASSYAEATFRKLIQRGTGWIKPDERDLRELTNKHAAILIRNSIFSLLPADLIDDAVEACLKTLSKKGKPNIDAMVASFAELGVTAQEIEEYIKRPIAEITPDEIARLRGFYNAMKDGQAKKEEVFNKASEDPNITVQMEEKLFGERK